MPPVRRLAAILAADVAGYSHLRGVDEEGTLAALKALGRVLADPLTSPAVQSQRAGGNEAFHRGFGRIFAAPESGAN
jgi:hypothetical protein